VRAFHAQRGVRAGGRLAARNGHAGLARKAGYSRFSALSRRGSASEAVTVNFWSIASARARFQLQRQRHQRRRSAARAPKPETAMVEIRAIDASLYSNTETGAGKRREILKPMAASVIAPGAGGIGKGGVDTLRLCARAGGDGSCSRERFRKLFLWALRCDGT